MLLDFLKAALLGILQGITEFLPISSTGHLIIAEKILGVSQVTFGLAFDAALHLGTAAAILLCFGKDILIIFASWLKNLVNISRVKLSRQVMAAALSLPREVSPQSMPGWLIIFGILPVVILGLMLEGIIGTVFRSMELVAWNLILFSAVFFLAEKFGKKSRSMENMTIRDALIIGISQAIALLPGVSRSGITIAAGLLLGLMRSEAARFSFLMAAPLFLGAGTKKLLDVAGAVSKGLLMPGDVFFFAVGFIFSVISGYIAVRWLLRFFRNNSLNYFAAYRIILGLLIIMF